MTEKEMGNAPSKETITSIDWFWVAAGSVVGFLLIGLLVFMSSVKFHNPAIPYLIGGLAYIITGMILGHYSPGHTVKEAALAGLIIPITGILMIEFDLIRTHIVDLSVANYIALIAGGILLTQLGGWIGEELEGYDHPTKFIQWHWIIVASVLGFMLNCFILFFVAIFVYKVIPIAIFLALSVVISGIVAGYKSPGHTEMECGIAGAITILADYLFLYFGLEIEIPVWILIVALIGGGIFGLFGGWIGERIQQREETERKELE
jgi:hypothetical protein